MEDIMTKPGIYTIKAEHDEVCLQDTARLLMAYQPAGDKETGMERKPYYNGKEQINEKDIF